MLPNWSIQVWNLKSIDMDKLITSTVKDFDNIKEIAASIRKLSMKSESIIEISRFIRQSGLKANDLIQMRQYTLGDKTTEAKYD